jgi:hypothetical protein
LSLFRVYRYLIRKLNSLDLFSEASLTDLDVEIICNGNQLRADMKLAEIKELFWKDKDDPLILSFRKSIDVFQEETNKNVLKQKVIPPKPPLWIPDHLAFNCMNLLCNSQFTFFTRVHHCRNCGK